MALRSVAEPALLLLVVTPLGLVMSMQWRRLRRRRTIDLADRGPAAAPQRWVSAGLAIGLAALAGLVWFVGPSEIAAALRGYRPVAVIGAVACQAVALFSLSQVYRSVYALTGGRLSVPDALRVSLGAYACMQMLPAGGVIGGVYAARQLTRRGGDAVAAATTVVLFGLLSMGTLATMLSVAIAISASVSGSGGRYAGFAVAFAALFIAGIVLVRAVLTRPEWRQGVGRHLHRVRWRGRALFAGVLDDLDRHRDVLRHPKFVVVPMAWSALAWSAAIAMFAILVYAAGGATFTTILIAFAVAHLLNGLPLTPGGLGLVEVGLVGTMVAFGADAAVASVAVVSYRLVASWLPVAVALPFVGGNLRATVIGETRA